MKKWLFKIGIFLLVLAIGCWFWSLFDVNSGGGWWQGVWQGVAWPWNFVRSWFTGCLCKSPGGSTAYNIFFWLNAIPSTFGLIRTLFIKLD